MIFMAEITREEKRILVYEIVSNLRGLSGMVVNERSIDAIVGRILSNVPSFVEQLEYGIGAVNYLLEHDYAYQYQFPLNSYHYTSSLMPQKCGVITRASIPSRYHRYRTDRPYVLIGRESAQQYLLFVSSLLAVLRTNGV